MMLMIHIICIKSNKVTKLKEKSNKNTKKNRMSTMQKVFIGLGICAVVVGGYFIVYGRIYLSSSIELWRLGKN